jgi:Dyp-type peroxidase family
MSHPKIINDLIERSSLGTPRAKALRALTTDAEVSVVRALIGHASTLGSSARDSDVAAHIEPDNTVSVQSTGDNVSTYPPSPAPGPPPPPPQPAMRPQPVWPTLFNDPNVQGNVLAAFNKDFELFLFLQVPDQARGQAFLTGLLPLVSKNNDVAAFNQAFSAARRAAGDDPDDLSATWVNVSLTDRGLGTISPQAASVLGQPGWDETVARFTAGAGTAPDVVSTGPEAPANWYFGSPTQMIDVIITLAADSATDLFGIVQEIRQIAARHGVVTVFEQDGRSLPGMRHGHEHFGFKDGISQPGVTGFDQPDGSTPTQVEGKPGTLLIEAGEFVLGYPGHDNPGRPVPSWMFDGSFLVLRRLAQDVPGWWAQAETIAGQLELSGESIGAKLVGRWRSGVPVVVDPNADPRSGADLSSDNNFDYSNDPAGASAPLCAHIRKVNPRAGTGPGQDSVSQHRILRRGIAFGAPFDPAAGKDHGPDAERGLVFACYQASIGNQFEFLQQAWADNLNFPIPAAGPDPVIGEAGQGNIVTAAGPGNVTFTRFVRLEGAIYAFTPSIPTLASLASGGTLPTP